MGFCSNISSNDFNHLRCRKARLGLVDRSPDSRGTLRCFPRGLRNLFSVRSTARTSNQTNCRQKNILGVHNLKLDLSMAVAVPRKMITVYLTCRRTRKIIIDCRREDTLRVSLLIASFKGCRGVNKTAVGSFSNTSAESDFS